ncbi:Bifunctional DNA primase/polymerase [Thermodesulfatator indicus DSM 15286]|uniref:Bifunctional DNA primase/polymerase n=1 Tax=Thermodesulfatator indicus (strain DSM 15286 / JCM 11887 / CIR29812) TaxID=667014 RepID=F8AAE4_THEID|nr:bifunctional DNA primase/polymerase [Thermodesulfatator indicus]AEH45364.1 Bifunctional DNA primase/polymerase [Thermodesulfatator indicus DSM 15286]
MDYLEHYLRLGWAILPLRPRSKAPALPWGGFQKKPPGVKEWVTWRVIFPIPPHGVAVMCGAVSNLIVIDCDDKEVVSRLLPEIPFDAPTSQTKRGFHFFFRYQPGIPSTTIEVTGIGRLEIKSDRSLVTLPPSTHPEGHRYEWVLAPWDVDALPELPNWLVELLQKQERRKELARQVGYVSFPRPGRKLTPEALREILTQVGTEIVKEVPIGDREALRLKSCPICGKSEGNPWIWADSGRLLDFRATCPASRDRGGLSLRAWLREIGQEGLLANLEVGEAEEVSPPEVPAASVDEARVLVLKALRAGGDSIITVPPGVGKSRTTLEWLAKEGPRPAVYSVPTLGLAQELAEAARALTADPVLVFAGRNKETCFRWEEARTAHDLGYDPGQVLCPTCPHNPKTVVFSQKCEFMRQFEGVNREKGLFFASHKLACHLIKDFLKKAKVWILDEELHSLVEVVKCPLDALRTLRAVFPEDSVTMRLADVVLEVEDDLHKAANGKSRAEGRIYARKVGFGPWQGKKPLAQWLGLDLIQLSPTIRDEIARVLKAYRKPTLFRKGVNLKALQWIQEVTRTGLAYLVARKDPCRPIELRRVVNPVPEKWRGRLIVLDATAYPPVVERALKRPGVQVLDIRVPVEMRTAWIKRSVSKTAIAREKGRKTAIKALKQALKEIKAEKILIFCHQAIKAKVEEVVAQDPRKIVVTHHFGAETRGTNQFADFETVILLGLPVVNPAAYYDTALALGLSEQEWEDWLHLLAQAGAWQEIHRTRPVLQPGKQVLVIAPRWPFKEWLGRPRRVIEPEEVKGALDLATKVLLLWVEDFGFVYVEIALLLSIGRPEQIPPVEVRAEVWQRIRGAFPKEFVRFFTKLESLYRASGNPLSRSKHPRPSQEIPVKGGARGSQKPFIYILKGHREPLELGISGNSKGFPPPFKGNLITNADNKIEFFDKKWWPKLFARLRKARPDLPVFEVQIRTKGGLQKTRGIGDIKTAQDFYRALGREIDFNSWREVVNV